MNYFAIDTAGNGTVIVVRAGERVFSFVDCEPRRASEIALVAADKLLDEAGLTLSECDCFGCGVGPGSFTGIRLGLTVAKSFAFATGKPLAAVNSLYAAAYNARGKDALVAIRAYADFCYTAAVGADGSMSPAECIPYGALAARLDRFEGSLVGDEFTASKYPAFAVFDPVTALIGGVDEAAARGALRPYREVEPEYVLESQAERNLRERDGK